MAAAPRTPICPVTVRWRGRCHLVGGAHWKELRMEMEMCDPTVLRAVPRFRSLTLPSFSDPELVSFSFLWLLRGYSEENII